MRIIFGESYYSIDEVAEMFSLTPQTIYTMAKKGILRAKKLSKFWAISEADIKAYLEEKNQRKIQIK